MTQEPTTLSARSETPELVLGLDTSGGYCAAALVADGAVLVSTCEEMTRGQAERLMPLLEDILAQASVGWHDLSALGVGIGPGNFTGIRIGVSAARGLALGLDVPAVGVSGCEARVHLASPGTICAIPAPRDTVYLCDPVEPSNLPSQMPITQAEADARDAGLRLQAAHDPKALAQAIALIAAARWRTTNQPPAPLYVRAANAALSQDTPPVLLD